MKDKYRLGFVKLAVVVCALLLALVPAAFAKCVDSEGNEHDDHKWGDWEVTEEPTCKEEGKKVRYCERCDEKDKKSIDALGHDYGDWQVTREPSCKDEGKRVKTCSRCGKEKEESIDALGHDWSDWSTEKEPTCEDSGKRVKTCSRCGDTKEEKIDALGHDWSDWSTDKEPTCEDSGKRVKTCSRCGATKEEKIDALGHSWSDWSTDKEPTCEDSGKRVRTCGNCGKTEEEKIDALGHSWSDWSTEKEPACEEKGKRVRSCGNCGKTEEEGIEALGHDYTSAKTDPTCEEAGVVTYTCSRCGNTYTEAGDAALGHDWGEWQLTEATETTPPTQTRACKRCGMEETEVLEMPEELEKTAAVPVKIIFEMGYATMEVNGNAGETIDETSIPATTWNGYVFDNWDQELPKVFPDADTTITALWKRLPVKKVSALEDVKIDTFKPALEDALKLLPTAAEATLEDGTVIKATLVWNNDSCKDYGDKTDDGTGNGTYTFNVAAIKDEAGIDCPLASDLNATCKLVVGAASGDYQYNLDADGRAVIAKYLGSESNVLEIPQKLDDHDVVAIDRDAFSGGKFAGVVLPIGLKRIGANAFAGCENLAALEVPAGVAAIGDGAFSNCANLTMLTLPDSLTSIGKDVTLGDDALTSLILSASLESTLTSATGYSRVLQPGEEGYDANNPDQLVNVTLPMAVTDISVYSPSATPFTIGCAYTVAEDCGITVQVGAGLTVGANLTNKGGIVNFGNVTVDGGVTLDNNAGAFENDGTTDTYGRIVTCAGEWTGSDAKKHSDGSFVKNHEYELIKFDHYECKACGHTKKFTKPALNVKFSGSTLYKPYDKSRNIQGTDPTTKQSKWLLNRKLTRSDFKPETVTDEVTGKKYNDVSISLTGATISKFSKADAGSYNLTLTIQLTGDDLEYYNIKKSDGKYKVTLSIPARIDKRKVTITPTAGQGKKYGAKDPSWISFSQSGLLNLTKAEEAAGAKLYTGKLARETGEDVKTYKITIGTLDFGNKNYDVSVANEVFTISKKPLTDSDIGMVTIGNQRYTGKEVKPAVTLRYGMRTLKEGTDFKVEYKDNISPGSNTAKVTITGIGNYTDKKTASFSILNISDDFGKDSSGSGSYHYDGFDRGEFEDASDGDDEKHSSDDGILMLDDEEYGSVLFSALGEARPFAVFEEKDELVPEQRTLTIIADPMVDEVTGESLFLEDGIRERYDELHLRLTNSLVQKLMQKGVTEVVYELEQAELRIPLSSLLTEIPMMAATSEEAEEPLEALDDEDVDEEFVVEESEEEPLEGGEEADETVGEVGSFDEAGIAPGTPMMKVQTYDFCIEQADATGLSPAEAEVLEEGELMLPAYRVSVRVVPADAEMVPTGLTDENGKPIEQYLDEPMPEGFYLQDLTLQLQPDGNLVAAPEGAQAIYLATEAPDEVPEADEADEDIDAMDDEADEEIEEDIEEDIDDADEDIEEDVDEVIEPIDSVISPVEFVDVDGALVAQVPVNADGLYAVRAPEDWDPDAYMVDEAGDEGLFGDEIDDFDDEEDFDDEGDFEEDGFDDEGFDDEFEELI